MTASTTLVAVVAIALSIATVLTDPVTAHTFSDRSCLAFASKRQNGAFLVGSYDQHTGSELFVRGGATEVESEKQIDLDEDDDEMEIESSDDEEELDPKLAKSALTAASKRKAKAAGAVKAAVSSKLQETATSKEPSKKKSSKSILKLLKIPYIVQACLNPFILLRMTKGYFASLVNLDYLKEKKVSTTFICRGRLFFC